jgi:protein-disulfide isomerase
LTTRTQQLAVAVGLAVILVVVAIVVSQGGSDDEEDRSADEVTAIFEDIPQSGMELGDPDAPVVVSEFGDMQCPFCADFAADAIPQIVEDYVRPGRIRLDFQALTFIGPDSDSLARLVAAASLQDRAWETIELLYDRQGAENSGYATDEFLAEIAAEVPGLDAEQALADADTSPEVDRILQRATAAATELGINSTPSFAYAVDGSPQQVLDGVGLDAASFAAAIDPVLADAEGG